LSEMSLLHFQLNRWFDSFFKFNYSYDYKTHICVWFMAIEWSLRWKTKLKCAVCNYVYNYNCIATHSFPVCNDYKWMHIIMISKIPNYTNCLCFPVLIAMRLLTLISACLQFRIKCIFERIARSEWSSSIVWNDTLYTRMLN